MKREERRSAKKPSLASLIRRYCRDECMGGNWSFVAECLDKACPFHPYRESEQARPAAGILRIVRRFCMRCVSGERAEIRNCPAKSCPLWPYRFGVKPATVKKMRDRLARPKELLLPLEG